VLREFALRQDQVFLRRSCGGGTLPAHGFASSVPEYTHASSTLNDTKLRKSFRSFACRTREKSAAANPVNSCALEAEVGKLAPPPEEKRPVWLAVIAKRRNPPPLQRVTADGYASSSLACRHLIGDTRLNACTCASFLVQ
jgi:hypothetical protein